MTRAAEKMHLTQSAISSRITALESELGVALLDRRGKQIVATEFGLRFFTFAQRFLELQRDVKLELGASSPQPTILRVGAIESVLHAWLMPLVENLRSHHPGLELELTVATTQVLLDQIRRGSLDLILATLPATTEGLRNRMLSSMDMVFVGNAQQHRQRTYQLTDLAKLDLLTFERGSQPHVALVDLFRQAHLDPKRVHAISSMSAMAQLVDDGFGVATLPRAAAQRLLQNRKLKILKANASLQPLPIFATFRSDPTSLPIELVVQEVLHFVGQRPSMRE